MTNLCTISEIEKLEKCHETAVKKLLNLPSKTLIQMLYFITGSTPIRITIKRRSLVYLHNIINQNEVSLNINYKQENTKIGLPKY